MYLVECFWPDVNEQKLTASARRARETADDLRRQGRHLRFVGSILVPADETVFYLFHGDESDVRAATEEAGLPCERILDALAINGAESGNPWEWIWELCRR